MQGKQEKKNVCKRVLQKAGMHATMTNVERQKNKPVNVGAFSRQGKYLRTTKY